MEEKILIAYASRYGSTREVAEKMADTLHFQGFTADVQPVEKVKSVADYASIILGMPIYFGSWPKDIHHFLERNRDTLTGVNLFIFSLGPTHVQDGETAEAKEQNAHELAKYPWLSPRSMVMFGGRFDPSKLRFPDTLITALPASPLHGLAFSDLRDWDAIRIWVEETALSIKTNTAVGSISR
jgi:menaquinone-dependent protoporphyrinogen oxidase